MVDALIRRVFPIEEVHDNDVVLLSITMATANPLFYALWVPWQVVVHNKRTKLEVDSLCSSLGRDHDATFFAEVIN